MPIKCPPSTNVQYRFSGNNKKRVRLGGCAKRGRFIKVIEVKPYRKKNGDVVHGHDRIIMKKG